MKDRIQKLLDKEHLSPSKFADLLGIQRSSVSHILSGRNNPSLDFVQRVLLKFNTISTDWLLFGNGEMYKNKKNPLVLFETEQAEKINKHENDKSESGSDNLNFPKKEIFQEIENTEKKQTESQSKQEFEVKKNTTSQNQEKINNVMLSKNTKTPVRIIIFYSDKTFIEYIPSE